MAYTYSIDKFTGAMVGLLSAKPLFDEPKDYSKLIESIKELASAPAPLGEHIFIFEVKSDCPPPSALWRKKFANARDQLERPMIFYLVSPNTMIRGVVTAVNWVAPPKIGTAGAFASVPEAISAVEQRLKQHIPLLSKLYEQVLNRAK